MTWYLLTVYAHILLAVFWIGYALFWTIMIGSLKHNVDVPESARLLRLINRSPWPPTVIPVPYRMTFPGLGWAALLLLVATGILILNARGVLLQHIASGELFAGPFGWTLGTKLILVIALLICQLLLSYRPAPAVIYLNMLVALFVVILSVSLVH